ncbi:isochorismatase family protein [Streptomyces griseoloalbus]|uniref:Isochorismate hydrolase n=1 Tax=Streptomyces griseoloalbus TaxID=67303 RepID=A0A7W8BTW0_9ACTN|nr:isochorismatase family protein [Streptomyces albaduncus]MBB5128817.1 isochorismate hydrolase [Streptomyces albaduncus]GGV78557.1 phenazine biosynthesis protein PhzD [Streptomyces griseoloalbus]GGW43627.1 phenazine biosynthesis protein PhzD [Streptomyces albaduncus]
MPGIPPIEPYPMPQEGELPENTVSWPVNPRRAVLLLHDMQEYFLKPFPRSEAPGDALVGNTALLRERCVELGIPIAYTAQPGGMTPEQRGLLADFWGPGMKPTPEHRKVVEPLEPGPGDWTFTKWRYSAFFKSDLLERMRSDQRDQLIICGVYAHVGVLMTAVEAFTHDIQPFLVADAVADFSAEYHRLALDYAAQRAARVVSAKTVLSELDAGGTAL